MKRIRIFYQTITSYVLCTEGSSFMAMALIFFHIFSDTQRIEEEDADIRIKSFYKTRE